ncbi:uncharacterized protein LOC143295010 isoform X2 [Babylonia areolata]
MEGGVKQPDGTEWPVISDQERITYELLFYSQGPVDGYLLGEGVRDLFLKSGLSLRVLSQIWNLADVSNDNVLNVHEFSLVMHLIRGLLKGLKAPQTLPRKLTPPKTQPVSVPAMTAREREAYTAVFRSLDPQGLGVLEGDLCRHVFEASELTSEVLTQVWDLCDVTRDGKLDLEEFCVACHLLRFLKAGHGISGPVDVFTELPDKVDPQSLRARKRRVQQYEQHKQKLMSLKEKRRQQVTQENKRLQLQQEKLDLLQQVYKEQEGGQSQEQFSLNVAKQKEEIDKLEEIVFRLKKEHEKVRQETVKIILAEQKLNADIVTIKKDTDELNKRLGTCHTHATKDPDPFHQLYEQRKEKRQGSTIKDLDKIEVSLPFTFNPFDPGLDQHVLAQGAQLFAAGKGNNHGGSKGGQWQSVMDRLAGFGEGFESTLAPCGKGAGEGADDVEEDPVFKEISVSMDTERWLGYQWGPEDEEGVLGLSGPDTEELQEKLLTLRAELRKLNEPGTRLVFKNPEDYLARKRAQEEEEKEKDRSRFQRRSLTERRSADVSESVRPRGSSDRHRARTPRDRHSYTERNEHVSQAVREYRQKRQSLHSTDSSLPPSADSSASSSPQEHRRSSARSDLGLLAKEELPASQVVRETPEGRSAQHSQLTETRSAPASRVSVEEKGPEQAVRDPSSPAGQPGSDSSAPSSGRSPEERLPKGEAGSVVKGQDQQSKKAEVQQPPQTSHVEKQQITSTQTEPNRQSDRGEKPSAETSVVAAKARVKQQGPQSDLNPASTASVQRSIDHAQRSTSPESAPGINQTRPSSKKTRAPPPPPAGAAVPTSNSTSATSAAPGGDNPAHQQIEQRTVVTVQSQPPPAQPSSQDIPARPKRRKDSSTPSSNPSSPREGPQTPPLQEEAGKGGTNHAAAVTGTLSDHFHLAENASLEEEAPPAEGTVTVPATSGQREKRAGKAAHNAVPPLSLNGGGSSSDTGKQKRRKGKAPEPPTSSASSSPRDAPTSTPSPSSSPRDAPPLSRPGEVAGKPHEDKAERRRSTKTKAPPPPEQPRSNATPKVPQEPAVKVTQEPTPTVKVTREPTPTVKVTQEPTPTVKVTREPTPTVKVTREPTPTVKVTKEPTPTAKTPSQVEETTAPSTLPAQSNGPVERTSVVSEVEIRTTTTTTPTPTKLQTQADKNGDSLVRTHEEITTLVVLQEQRPAPSSARQDKEVAKDLSAPDPDRGRVSETSSVGDSDADSLPPPLPSSAPPPLPSLPPPSPLPGQNLVDGEVIEVLATTTTTTTTTHSAAPTLPQRENGMEVGFDSMLPDTLPDTAEDPQKSLASLRAQFFGLNTASKTNGQGLLNEDDLGAQSGDSDVSSDERGMEGTFSPGDSGVVLSSLPTSPDDSDGRIQLLSYTTATTRVPSSDLTTTTTLTVTSSSLASSSSSSSQRPQSLPMGEFSTASSVDTLSPTSAAHLMSAQDMAAMSPRSREIFEKARHFADMVQKPAFVVKRDKGEEVEEDFSQQTLQDLEMERRAVISQSTMRRKGVLSPPPASASVSGPEEEEVVVVKDEVVFTVSERAGETDSVAFFEVKEPAPPAEQSGIPHPQDVYVSDHNDTPEARWQEKSDKVNLYSENVVREPDSTEVVDRESIANLASTRRQWEAIFTSSDPKDESAAKPRKNPPRWEVRMPYAEKTCAGPATVSANPVTEEPDSPTLQQTSGMADTESAIEREIRLAMEREEMLRREQEERLRQLSLQGQPGVKVSSMESSTESELQPSFHELAEADRGSEFFVHHSMQQQEDAEREESLQQGFSHQKLSAVSKSDVSATESIIEREIRLQREREAELALQRGGRVAPSVVSAEPGAPNPPVVEEEEREVVVAVEEIPYEEAISQYNHEGESRIARELRELKEREEEVRQLRERMNKATVSGGDTIQQKAAVTSAAKPTVKQASTPQTPRGDKSAPTTPRADKPHAPTVSFSRSVHLSPRGDNTTTTPTTPTTTTPTPKKPTPKPETPIQREIRLARERENELRRVKGLPELKPEPQKQESLEEKEGEDMVVTPRYHLNQPDTTMRRFASDRLQQEILDQRNREMKLRQEGKIISTSEEHIQPLRYAEVIGHDQTDGLVKRNFRTPARRSSNASDGSASGESTPRPQAAPHPPKESAGGKKSAGTGAVSFSYREFAQTAESKIERELREMREREEELR